MPVGNTSLEYAPHNTYPCQGDDRWCVIVVQSEAQWQSLCEVMGNTELLTDPRFATTTERRRNAIDLDTIITAWTTTQNAADVMAVLQKARVPCGAVQKGEDLFIDPQLRARNLTHVVKHASLGDIPVANLPVHFAETSFDPPRAMDNLGADNERVYCDLLGYSREQLAAWEKEGVVR